MPGTWQALNKYFFVECLLSLSDLTNLKISDILSVNPVLPPGTHFFIMTVQLIFFQYILQEPAFGSRPWVEPSPVLRTQRVATILKQSSGWGKGG